MNKLDNKGLTLIELIVSISLMSIVMLFLYRLLGNVTYDSDNEFFASKNQEQRIEMIDYIHTLLRANEITVAPSVTRSSSSATIKITQGHASNVYSVVIYAKRIEVKKGSTLLRVWDLEKGTYSFSEVKCTKAEVLPNASDTYHPYLCKIPLYTVNGDNTKKNNNTLDDLTLSFLAKG